jgi:hypothetical protein
LNSWSNSALTDTNRNYGTAVLLPLYPPTYTTKVIALGGGASPALSSTKVIDPSTATSLTTWTAGPDMVAGRIELGAVLLPSGRLLVHGGSLNNESPDTNGKKAEIYDPDSGAFTAATAGTAAYSRLYHSTSLLLPDARVAVMGGNSGDRGRYLGAIEIYTPSYLYDANDRLITTARPQITSAPTSPLGYNAGFSVSYTSNTGDRLGGPDAPRLRHPRLRHGAADGRPLRCGAAARVLGEWRDAEPDDAAERQPGARPGSTCCSCSMRPASLRWRGSSSCPRTRALRPTG